MIGANADPACILSQIVNSIGNVFLLPEIMHLDVFGLTPRPPFAAPILVVPYFFLLFRVYGNGWSATLQEFRRLRIDVFKLRIAIQTRGTLLRLAVHLQAVFLFVQQFRNLHMAHLVSPGAQFVGEISHAFACPPQWGLRTPRVTGSSSFSRSSSRFGSLSEAFFRPPPFCRIGRRVRCERSGFFCNSVKPLQWLAWKRHWRAPPVICRPSRGLRSPQPPIT